LGSKHTNAYALSKNPMDGANDDDFQKEIQNCGWMQPLCDVGEMWWTSRRSSKIGIFLQQLGSRNLINQLFMVELVERAIDIEIIEAPIESMEIQIESRKGRAKNYTFKRRKKELWDT
jgi:hypothetical protein